MFPFKIRFKKTLSHFICSEHKNEFLEYVEKELKERKVHRIFKREQGFTFDNDLISLANNWRLMAYVDSGSVSLEKVNDASFRIVYEISVIKNFLLSFAFIVIILVTDNDSKDFIILFIGVILVFWIFYMLRHYVFLREIAYKCKEIIKKD